MPTPDPSVASEPKRYFQGRQINLDDLRRQFADTEAKLNSLEHADYQLSSSSLYTIAEAYQLLCQRYAYLSTFYPNTSETRQAHALVSYGRRLLYGRRLSATNSKLLYRARDAFQKLRGYCLLAATTGIFSALLAALLVTLNPSFAWHFMSEEMAANLQQGKLWTEGIQGMSSLASSGIMTNNIKVTFLAFALGVTGGVLTLMITIFNGAMIGGLFAAVHHYGMANRLLDFIVAHGILELSVIIVACGCGLALGDALIHPGTLPRKTALQLRARPAVDLMLFSALWLIPAGIVEGYVSPYAYVPFSIKITVGLVLGLSYWGLLVMRK